MQLTQIPMDLIFSDSSWNCRGAIAPIDVETLAESIKVDGLMQAIVVQPYKHPPYRYKIVVGHRRHAACKRLKMTEIPANVMENLSEDTARSLNLKENLERKDLNMLQEARAIQWFRDRGLQLREVAKRAGKSTGWVTSRYMILDLEPEIQMEIAAGLLTQAQIEGLHLIPSKSGRYEAVKKAKEAKARGESTDVIEVKVKKTVMTDTSTKVSRKNPEIFQVQDMVTDSVGPNIATRSLAWCAGVISTKDYLESLKEEYPDFVGELPNAT